MSTTTTIRVGVVGAGGRMGRTMCAAMMAADDIELVAAVDPGAVGAVAGGGGGTGGTGTDGVVIAGQLDALLHADANVVVDFTVASATRVTLPWLAAHGIHAVVGTTGLTDDDIAQARAAFTKSNCIIAPNYAISAVLMMRFAELAAPYFESAEIIELHHNQKVDSPSGTALATAKRMAAASTDWAADPTQHHVLAGARGGQGPGGIPIHSVRLRGLHAHQEVILGAVGQSLTIRQDSYDHASYVPGVLLACRRVGSVAGVSIGLETYLDV